MGDDLIASFKLDTEGKVVWHGQVGKMGVSPGRRDIALPLLLSHFSLVLSSE